MQREVQVSTLPSIPAFSNHKQVLDYNPLTAQYREVPITTFPTANREVPTINANSTQLREIHITTAGSTQVREVPITTASSTELREIRVTTASPRIQNQASVSSSVEREIPIQLADTRVHIVPISLVDRFDTPTMHTNNQSYHIVNSSSHSNGSNNFKNSNSMTRSVAQINSMNNGNKSSQSSVNSWNSVTLDEISNNNNNNCHEVCTDQVPDKPAAEAVDAAGYGCGGVNGEVRHLSDEESEHRQIATDRSSEAKTWRSSLEPVSRRTRLVSLTEADPQVNSMLGRTLRQVNKFSEPSSMLSIRVEKWANLRTSHFSLYYICCSILVGLNGQFSDYLPNSIAECSFMRLQTGLGKLSTFAETVQ
jgi:hypothetical protein